MRVPALRKNIYGRVVPATAAKQSMARYVFFFFCLLSDSYMLRRNTSGRKMAAADPDSPGGWEGMEGREAARCGKKYAK